MAPVIETRLLNKIYRGAIDYHALHDIDLQVQSGEMLALMGSSGSGKSTLMNILGCLDRQSSGEYVLAGEAVAGLNDAELARIRNQQLGFVFQNFNLLPRYSARQNVELPLIYAGLSPRERHKRAVEALEQVGLGDRINNRPNELSGGQKQRVAIARAIVNRPTILMADEPTGALDTRTSEEILQVFQHLHKAGLTLMMVTHEPDVAACCQRILQMQDGRLIDDRQIAQRSLI
ncbi:MAG: ABC transporter ATP-binding protein [Candidatus Sericytochromatia bacterium]|nr:ABC transporter ATP-binding protein [Candidatus Sericytochromatia bacterium]